MPALRLVAGWLALAACCVSTSAHADANALWKIVHGACVPDMQAHRVAAPCTMVDLAGDGAHGFAVLKDRVGRTQYLLIPTARITGIESPAILEPDAVNYFAEAWSETPLVGARLPPASEDLPRQDLALAINSVAGRSQNQLHIHMDCIRPDVARTLARVGPSIGEHWHALPVTLAGHRYQALWLPGETLGERNPFHLLAQSLADPAREMGAHTLVLVGAERRGTPGFYLLDGEASAFSMTLSARVKLGSGSGEEIEDHQCRIADAPVSAS